MLLVYFYLGCLFLSVFIPLITVTPFLIALEIVGLAGGELHHQGAAGAEGDFCLDLGGGGAEVGHAPALGYGCNGEDALHPGEALADALAVAAAEGEVGELRAGGFVFGAEAVGGEAGGGGEVLGGAARDVLAEE